MADLVRALDWSATPLGRIEAWPESLLTSVNILLGSRHPLFLWWGDDLIQFYNDAYRPSLGRDKHPRALGQRGQDCWHEVWASIGPQIYAVLHGGESTWNVDQYLPIYRNGDQFEDAWWTFSYSPVLEASGHVGGVFVVVSETTNRVRAERELNRSRERLQLALAAADLGTWSYNPQDEIFTADANMQRIFGAPEPTGDHDFWQQQLHPDDRCAAREEFAAAFAGMRPYHLEYRVLHPSGVRWIRSKGNVLAADTGTGMPPETLARIFEPFYTTKGVAGTGLGLWISKEILERHRGYLHVRSSRRRGHAGTVVSLFLPLEAVTR
jgi:PAS domain-containing protein